MHGNLTYHALVHKKSQVQKSQYYTHMLCYTHICYMYNIIKR